MDFRKKLKLQLAFSDMSVKELAGLSGVKKTTIDSYLNRRVRMPAADAALRLARTLGVSVEHLLGEKCGPPGGGESPRKRARVLAREARDLAQKLRAFADLLEGVT